MTPLLLEHGQSHVYLVQLFTFDPTADGRAYFKIGKVISIPKQIKQNSSAPAS